MSEVRPLIGRVIPFEGESLQSVLARAAALNGFQRISELYAFTCESRHQKPAHGAFSRNAALPGDICKLLDLDTDSIDKLFHPIVDQGELESIKFNGTLLPRRFIEARARRYSPASLRNAKFGRTVWTLRPLQFCPESMEMLIDRCQCGHKLTWTAVRDIHACESCGRSLCKARPGKVDWKMRADAKDISDLVHSNSKVRTEALGRLPAPFGTWEPGDAFVAIVEMGVVLSDLEDNTKAVSGTESFAKLSTAHLVAGYQTLKGWPDSFHGLVRKCSEGRSGNRRSLLGPLGKFFDADRQISPICALIREIAPKLFHTGAIKLPVYRGFRSKWLTHGDVISERQASIRFGVDHATLRRLSGRGDCFISASTVTQLVSLYDASKLQLSVALLRDSIPEQRCATLIGVPASYVDAFGRCGLIAPIEDRDAHILADGPIYSRASMAELLSRSGRQHATHGPDEEISIFDLLRGRLNPSDWTAVVNAALSLRLPARHSGASGAIVQNLFVAKLEGNEFLMRLPNNPLPYDLEVSCMGAEKVSGMSNVNLNRAVAAKFLPGRKTKHGVMIRLGDLDGFNRKFVFGSEVSRLVGRPAREVIALMASAGFAAVARVHTTHLWKRNDVSQVFPICALNLPIGNTVVAVQDNFIAEKTAA